MGYPLVFHRTLLGSRGGHLHIGRRALLDRENPGEHLHHEPHARKHGSHIDPRPDAQPQRRLLGQRNFPLGQTLYHLLGKIGKVAFGHLHAARERRLLRNIERTMKLTIPEVELPNAELLGKRRLEKFAAKVQQQLESSDLDQYRALLSKIQPTAEGEELDLDTLAAALLKMAQGERTLIVPPDAPMRPKREFRDRDDRGPRDRNDRGPRGDREDRPRRERRDVGDMQLYRIEVGRDDGVEVRHIVGAIANEGDISSRYIGNIKLFASHSTIELPKGMPGEVLQHFTRTRILNKPMNMQLLGDAQPHTGGERRGGGRGFGGERREGGRNFSGERREGGRGDGRRFSGERREGRAPRRDDSTGRRRFGGDA